MPRIAATGILTAVALSVSACSPVDLFGPRADGEIMALAKQASADQFSGDAEWDELRARQAEQLQDEARRLCGTDENGATPSSCDTTYGDTDLPAAGDTAALVSATVTAADKVPEESVDLIIAQAIDAVAATDASLSLAEPIDDAASVEAAGQLLRDEYAVSFGLDVASAFADDATQARIDELRTLSDDRLQALLGILPAEGLPSREAGYEIPGGSPTNPAEASAFIEDLATNIADRWRKAASNADNPQWREAAIYAAGHAQRAIQS